MDNRSRDIGEGCEKVGQKGFMEGIVLQNSAEEEISVYLVSVFAANDYIVVFSLHVRAPGKIRIKDAEFQVEIL